VLNLAALLPDIGSGDEVIPPSQTFVSTPNPRRHLWIVDDATRKIMMGCKGRGKAIDDLSRFSSREKKDVVLFKGGAVLANDPKLVLHARSTYYLHDAGLTEENRTERENMLRSLTPLLLCPTCRRPDGKMRLEEFRAGEDGHVSDGVLICSNCRTWYPIERDVLEFVPPTLFDDTDLSAFCNRYAERLDGLNLKKPAASSSELYVDQIKQREHFDLYAEGAPGFSDYTTIPFIQATSTRYVRLAGTRLTDPGAWLLDIGCGTGALSSPLMKKCTVIAFDVSRKAVRRANEDARARGLLGTGTFFVGDGSYLPFVSSSFDHVNTLGALHHLPNPKEVIADIQRILKPGGVHFAIENNKSAFRKIFDLLMMIRPLWIEEAGTHPLISRQMVLDWTKGLPVRVDSETSVFLPPQLLNPLGKFAIPAVELSDRLFSLIPIWNRHGGQLIFSITKAEK